MRCLQVLSTLALRRLRRSSPPVGHLDVLQLQSCSHHIARALRQANARAWVAVEVLLAGEALWERAQLTWERSLDAEVFQPLRLFLDKFSLDSLDEKNSERLRKAGLVLRPALANALLTSGPLDLIELLPESSADEADKDGTQQAWRELERLTTQLTEAGYPELKWLFALRCGGTDPLMVILVAVLFRQAVEVDPDLFGDLTRVCKYSASDELLEDFRGLAIALDRHRDRLDALLASLREPTSGMEAPGGGVDTVAGVLRLERGKVCAQRGGYEQAIGEFTAAIQLHPSSAEAFLSRADAYRLKGDHAQALADYNCAHRLGPANARILLQRGQLQWIMGHLQEAIADYSAVLQIDPRNAVAYHYRGKALADTGDLDGAVVNYSEAMRLDPFYAWVYHDSGDAHTARGNHDRAIADFSEAIRLNPLATLSYLRRGDAYMAQKEFARASADYGNVLRLDPHSVPAYLSLGVAYREQGQYRQAGAELTRALELDFANVRLYYERGLVFQLDGDHELALLDFNAAASRNSKNAEVYFRRAVSHAALDDEKQALADLTLAIRLDPQHAGAHNSRGQLYFGREETDLALADLNTALQLDPDLTGAYVNRARILITLAQWDQARADCDQALEQDPDLAAVYQLRGTVLARQGEYAAAVHDFSRTLRMEPQNAQVFYLRGVAYLKQNNTRDALADLSEAIRLDPNHARAFAQRAAIRKASGQHKLALADLAHATRLDVQLAPAYCRQLGLYHSSLGMHECAAADYTLALCLDPKNAAAQAGRERAWQAYLTQPQKREAPAHMVQPLSVALPPLLDTARENSDPMQVPAQTGRTLASVAVETATQPQIKETAIHQPSRDTAIGTTAAGFEMSNGASSRTEGAITVDAETSEELVQELAPVDPSAVTFTLDIPAETTVTEEYDAVSGNGVSTQISDNSDAGISFELNEEPAERPQREAEQMAREEAESNRRRQLVEEFRKAEAERLKAEEERKKREAAARKNKKAERDYDDDDGMAKWKKGILIAASLFVAYWVTSWGWGFISIQRSTMKPEPIAVSGKVLSDVDGQPLEDVMVRFYPQQAPGMEASAVTDKQGNFNLGTFAKTDGAVAGSYVVTLEPINRRSAAFIPPEFVAPEKSPLKAEVTRTGPNQLDPFKIKL